tara:strand:+ start:719 stop:1123 length:405 start_codon:yes stop_codon:yes gene_type:complete
LTTNTYLCNILNIIKEWENVRMVNTNRIPRMATQDNHARDIELAEPIKDVLYINNKGSLMPKRTVLKYPTPIEHKTSIHIKIASILIGMFMGFLVVLVMLNWLMQCGEPIYFSDRTWTTGECLLIPYTPVSGTW